MTSDLPTHVPRGTLVSRIVRARVEETLEMLRDRLTAIRLFGRLSASASC
jgi:cell division ATPase FtsA